MQLVNMVLDLELGEVGRRARGLDLGPRKNIQEQSQL